MFAEQQGVMVEAGDHDLVAQPVIPHPLDHFLFKPLVRHDPVFELDIDDRSPVFGQFQKLVELRKALSPKIGMKPAPRIKLLQFI